MVTNANPQPYQIWNGIAFFEVNPNLPGTTWYPGETGDSWSIPVSQVPWLQPAPAPDPTPTPAAETTDPFGTAKPGGPGGELIMTPEPFTPELPRDIAQPGGPGGELNLTPAPVPAPIGDLGPQPGQPTPTPITPQPVLSEPVKEEPESKGDLASGPLPITPQTVAATPQKATIEGKPQPINVVNGKAIFDKNPGIAGAVYYAESEEGPAVWIVPVDKVTWTIPYKIESTSSGPAMAYYKTDPLIPGERKMGDEGGDFWIAPVADLGKAGTLVLHGDLSAIPYGVPLNSETVYKPLGDPDKYYWGNTDIPLPSNIGLQRSPITGEYGFYYSPPDARFPRWTVWTPDMDMKQFDSKYMVVDSTFGGLNKTPEAPTSDEVLAAEYADIDKPVTAEEALANIESGKTVVTETGLGGFKAENVEPEPVEPEPTEALYGPAAIEDVKNNVIILPDKSEINIDDWNALDEKYQHIALTEGYPAMAEAMQAEKAAFEANHIILPDGNAITVDEWNELPEKYQHIALTDGAKASIEAIDADNQAAEEAQQQTQQAEVKEVPSVDDFKEKYFADHGWNADRTAITRQGGPMAEKLKEYDSRLNQMTDAYRAQYGEEAFIESGLAKVGNTGIIAAEIIVPGVYSIRHWNELTPAEKALSIGIDALTIIPVAKGAGMAAREVGTAERALRLKAAAKGAVSELLAPVNPARQYDTAVDIALHPVQTAKTAGKNLLSIVEDIAHPKKIPEAVITTSNGTVRLRVSETTSAEEAMEIRDKLMQTAKGGEKPVVEADGVRYELNTSPLMKEAGGGLAHATGQGEKFEKGAIVKVKYDAAGNLMPPSEQGLFMSNEPLPRFAGTSAFGKTGEKAAIIIVSPETAKKAVSSEKLYKSSQGLVAEMESKFKVGTEIPAPKQKLFTRVGPEANRVEIYLEKPLSTMQIAKLKALGIAETIKAPFKPPITITGRAKTAEEVKELSKILSASGNKVEARNLIRAEQLLRERQAVAVRSARTARAIVPTIEDRINPGSKRANEIFSKNSQVLGRQSSFRRIGESGPVIRTPKVERIPVALRTTSRSTAERPTTGRAAPSRSGIPGMVPERNEMTSAESPRVTFPRDETARSQPPRTEPIRNEPVRVDQPRPGVPRVDIPRTEPPRVEPPRSEPPRTEPPRVEPPRTEPPRNEPPRVEPPRVKPPRTGPQRPPRLPDRPPRLTGKDNETVRPPRLTGDNGMPFTPEEIAKGSAIKAGMGWWIISGSKKKFYREDKMPDEIRPLIERVKGGKGSGYNSLQALEGAKGQAGSLDLGIIRAVFSQPADKPGQVRPMYLKTPKAIKRPSLKVEKVGKMKYLKNIGWTRRSNIRGRMI